MQLVPLVLLISFLNIYSKPDCKYDNVSVQALSLRLKGFLFSFL
jgi:hypothetical protein